MGFWTFDDCAEARSDLRDSSSEGHGAFRSLNLSCRTGSAADETQGKLAVFARPDDQVFVPDQPEFALDAGVTLSLWVKPEAVDRDQPIVRLHGDVEAAVALMLEQGQYRFSVRLASGERATVSAPARAGEWTHLAGTYDNALLRLYIAGSEVSRSNSPGSIARASGALLIGNDGSDHAFFGQLDNVWFNAMAAPDATIVQLSCLRRAPTLTVSPAKPAAVLAGTPVTFTLGVTNNDDAKCDPEAFNRTTTLPAEISIDRPLNLPSAPPPAATPLPPLVSPSALTLRPGETGLITIPVRSRDESPAGSYPLKFGVSGRPQSSGALSALQLFSSLVATVEAEYSVLEPSGCHVVSQRELMIRDISVVDDPVRTAQDVKADAAVSGAWSFVRLMQRLAPSDADAPAFTEAMLRSFLTPQSVNGFMIPARPPMDPLVLQPWPRTADGKLDLSRAPVRLLAIVNRLDLQDLAQGKAGEGRFVFGVLGANGESLQFTLIFEYALQAADDAGVRRWATDVHALQALPFPSEAYNQALQALTDRYTQRGAAPTKPNGSALIDIRTNELALSVDGQWQLREFHLAPETGALLPATLGQTPDASFDRSEALARFIQQNEAAVLAETHATPALFEDKPFQAASVFNNIDFWNAPNISNPEARHKFSLNTCNGCHGQETATQFLHVFPRAAGQPARLSNFLLGEIARDPVDGQDRRLSELTRRRQLLENIVCAN